MGLGFLFHFIARVAFAVSSVALHVYLGRLMSVESYGVVGLVLSIININYLFLSSGVRQAASMFIAQGIFCWGDLLYKCFVLQIFIGFFLFAANYWGASGIALMIGDANLEQYIKQASFVVPCTAILFLCLGVLNGSRRFIPESVLATIYPLLRLTPLCLIPLFPAIDKVSLVIGGLLISAILSAAAGVLLVAYCRELPMGKMKIPLRAIIAKGGALIILYAGITLLMNVDLVMVKKFAYDSLGTGLYTAASSFSKMTYFIAIALISVLIPTIGKAFHDGDIGTAQRVFTNGIEMFCFALAPMLVIGSVTGKYLFTLAYTQLYGCSADIFSVLLAALFFLCFAVYCNTVQHAVQDVQNYLTMILLLLIDIILCIVLIPRVGPIGAAYSLLAASVAGCLIFVRAIRGTFSLFSGRMQTVQVAFVNVGILGIALLYCRICPPDSLPKLFMSYVLFLISWAGLIFLILPEKRQEFSQLLQLIKRKGVVVTEEEVEPGQL